MVKTFVVFAILIGCFSLNTWKTTPYEIPQIAYFPAPIENTVNPLTEEGVLLGKYLFYDPILSQDSTVSCASCHKQQFAFSDQGTAFSIGINGNLTNRNAPPLFNLAWYDKLFWDGRAATIESQVSFPITSHLEMGSSWDEIVLRIQRSKLYPQLFRNAFEDGFINEANISNAIGQFERTLISYNSKFDMVLRGETFLSEDEYQGFLLMNNQEKGDCLHCHTTDAHGLGTNGKFANNGLDSVITDSGLMLTTKKDQDAGKFKIPSLRNIALTAPYMHDGRFETLLDVLDFYSEGLKTSATIDSKMTHIASKGVQISLKEKLQIIAFLNTLTDSIFISNPEFSSPF